VEQGQKPNAPASVVFFSVFDVACCLQIMCFGLHSTQFGWRSALVDLFFAWLLLRMHAMEGSADCQDKKGASGDGKLHSDIRA